MDLCTILLEQDVAVDARKYGKIVAPMLGVTALEAKMHLRHGRGILLEDIDEGDAIRLVEALAGDGVRARAVRNEDLPVLPPPHKANELSRTPGGLKYRWPGQPEPAELAWAAISVVSLGIVALPEYRDAFTAVRFDRMPALHRMEDDPEVADILRERTIRKLAEGPSEGEARRGRKKDETLFDELQGKYANQVRAYADLLDVPGGLWMRVPMDEVAYAHQEGQVKLGESWGFDLLVHDLRAHCEGAFTERSLHFTPEAAIKDLVFLQTEDFNRYTTWHAYLHHLGIKPCAPAATSSPSPEPPAPSTDAGSSNVSPPPEPPSTSP